MKNNNTPKTLDYIEMTEKAFAYCNEKLSHEELIKELNSENELKKQLCIINLTRIDSQNQADAIIYNLTGQSGLIREVTSIKINELLKKKEFIKFFNTKSALNKIINAIIDVNPTVCRNIIEILPFIEEKTYLITNITNKFFEAYEEVKDFKNYKSYEANKKIFKLYWYLESIFVLINEFEPSEYFIKILNIAVNFNDYTIREKAAKILSITNLQSTKISEYKSMLQMDENIYVKRHLIKL